MIHLSYKYSVGQRFFIQSLGFSSTVRNSKRFKNLKFLHQRFKNLLDNEPANCDREAR